MCLTLKEAHSRDICINKHTVLKIGLDFQVSLLQFFSRKRGVDASADPSHSNNSLTYLETHEHLEVKFIIRLFVKKFSYALTHERCYDIDIIIVMT